MRSLGDTAVDPQPGDSIEYQGQVYEVIYVEDDQIVYKVYPAFQKRARVMTRHGWKTLLRSGAQLSDYSSKPSSEPKK